MEFTQTKERRAGRRRRRERYVTVLTLGLGKASLSKVKPSPKKEPATAKKKVTPRRIVKRPVRTKEEMATGQLSLAMMYVRAKRKDKAIKILKEIVSKYGGTRSGIEAKQELDELTGRK